jgi:hypothetical protein
VERFTGMSPAAIEFVSATHMVEMSMGEYHHRISVEQLGQVGP